MVTALTDPQVFEVNPGLSPCARHRLRPERRGRERESADRRLHLESSAIWSDGVPIGVQDFILNWEEQATSGGTLPAGSQPGGNQPFDTSSTLGYSDIATITGASTGAHRARGVRASIRRLGRPFSTT